MEHRLWQGLELKYARLIEYCRDDKEALAAVMGAVEKAGEHGGAKGKEQGDIIPLVNHRGTSQSHTLSRLKRDRPELAAMVVAGELSANAAALEAYLRGKELQKPILGAQRRVEARIGQLLGDARLDHDRSKGATLRTSNVERPADRHDFRLLARGFECLTDEEWRRSRRALVSVVRNKFGCVLLEERRKWAASVRWLHPDRRAV